MSTASDRLAAWFRQTTGWTSATLPAYDGGSIANLPVSVLQAMAPEADRAGLLPSLDETLLAPSLLDSSRVVILLVLDGLGRAVLDAAIDRDDLAYLNRPQSQSTLTSVTPSTTAAALTSLQTGVGPGVHGLAGYTLYLRSQGQVYNMIRWKPVGGRLKHPAPSPEGFLPVPTLYQRLSGAGIDTVLVSNAAFENSPLTRIQASGVRYRGQRTLAELARHVVRQVERDDSRRFVFAYWDGVDAMGHSYGPDSPTVQLELKLIDTAIGEGIIKPLSQLGQSVTLLITADHGHVPEPHASRRDIDAQRRVSNLLRHGTTGEARAMGLSFRKPEGRKWLQEDFGESAVVFSTADAITAGLFGPGKHHPRLEQRIGGTLALARGDTSFSSPTYKSGSVGGHGSLTAGEMLVPLLAWSWD